MAAKDWDEVLGVACMRRESPVPVSGPALPSMVLFQARSNAPFAMLIIRLRGRDEARNMTRVTLIKLIGVDALILHVQTLTESGNAYEHYYPVEPGMSWEIR